jgi:hypothetical protein
MAREDGFFDDLARGLADGSLTRGKALRLMGAAVVGGTLGSLGIGEAAADPPGCKRNGKACKKNSQCCSGNCSGGSCQEPTTTTTTTEAPTTTTTTTPPPVPCGADFCEPGDVCCFGQVCAPPGFDCCELIGCSDPRLHCCPTVGCLSSSIPCP